MNPGYKLVPCKRGPVPFLKPYYDLSGSLSMAEEIIRKVDKHLQLSNDWFQFNGQARPAELEDGEQPLFYVQIWNDEGLRRSLAFRGIGFVGVLNIEEKKGNKNKCCFADYVGAVFDGIRQNTLTQRRDAPAYCLALVEGNLLHLNVPWRP